MDNPGLEPQSLWQELSGCLWHATSCEALFQIVADGAIKPNVGTRYPSALSRRHDAVSLFDFGPAAMEYPTQINNWTQWFGHEQSDRVAVWIELSREALGDSLVDAAATHSLWESYHGSGEPSPKYIPGVEALGKGVISTTAFRRILLVASEDRSIFQSVRWPEMKLDAELNAFRSQAPLPERDPIIEALDAARCGRS